VGLFAVTVETVSGCDAITAYSGDNHLPLLWRFYRSHRAVLFRLARTVTFDATTTDRALAKALQILLAHEDANGDWLPADVEVDLSFASEQWKRTVLARVDGRRRIARRHFEVCVFSNLDILATVNFWTHVGAPLRAAIWVRAKAG
jgi:hypothetical protein